MPEIPLEAVRQADSVVLESEIQLRGTGSETVARVVVGNSFLELADAVVGIDIDYEVLGTNGNMLMVTASGTAVKLA